MCTLCDFETVPNAFKFSRFKINFEKDLKIFFHSLVELKEPICKEINSELAKILIVDTTGIEAYVKENNPKLFDNLLRQSKKLKKSNSDFNAHSYACSKMPKESYAILLSISRFIGWISPYFAYKKVFAFPKRKVTPLIEKSMMRYIKSARKGIGL